MMINFFGDLYGPEVIASFSGAMLFTIYQHTWGGFYRIIIFTISFLMGIVGADIAASLMATHLPDDVEVGREAGAFACSALIVTLATIALERIENHLKNKSSWDGDEKP